MKFSRHRSTLPPLAVGLTLLAGCSSEQDQQANARAVEAATNSPLALYSAMENYDEELALGILRIKAGQKPIDEAGRTPLMVAARTNSTRVAWQLLPQKVNQLPTDEKGLNTLVHAARANETWLVGELLKRGASPNVSLPNGSSLIAECANQGRPAIVSLLLAHGAHSDSIDENQKPLVQIAASKGQAWLVNDLIRRGTKLNNANDKDDLILSHIVAQAGKPELVDILAQRGVIINITNKLGENPIHIAVGSGSFDIIKPLHQQGVSLNKPDNSGATPLHLAIMRRDPASLRELLTLGADPLNIGPENRLPIHLALEMREFEFASLLLQHGSPTPTGPLYSAIIEDDRNVIDFLLANQADPNALEGITNDTLLGAAIRHNNHWAASRLLEAGALPNALTKERQTAFHLAVAKLDVPLVKLMLEKGADPNIPFNEDPTQEFLDQVASENIAKSSLSRTGRFTPIALAADSGNTDLARLLLEHDADPALYTRGGRYHYWYPISWAARRADIPMMQILLGREPSEVTRRAVVDLSKQRAWIYDGDKEIYTTRVSTGKPGNRTRTGTFVVTNRHRHWNSTIYGSSMPYFQRLSCGDFGFHQGYVPGYAASHGCIRVPGGNVRKIWNLLSLGDTVKIVP